MPLTAFFFDCLAVDGEELLDRPLTDRLDVLAGVVPAEQQTARLVTADVAAAEAFFAAAVVQAGQEGVVVKDVAAPYAAGRRGSGWIKVKPRHTLDLVVLAVEKGSGRRRGYLSNIHLGARDPERPGEFVMLGKTFKGMTDEMLAWQTGAVRRAGDRPTMTATSFGSVRSRSWRSRSTGCSGPAGTRVASHCVSPACCATATTRPPPRRTR